MFKIKPAYRIPLIIAFLLHICLIIFLFVHLPASNYRLPGPTAKQPTKIVQAVAVDAKQIQAQVAQIKEEAAHKQAMEHERIQRLEEQAVAARKARLDEQHRLENLKTEQIKIAQQKAIEAAKLKALQQKHAEELKAQEKALQLKRAAAKKAKEKALKQQKAAALKAQQEALQKKLMQQELSTEQNQLSQQAQATEQRGAIDRYKAGILQAIGQKWVVPDGANKDLSSIYLIHLAPGGVVLDVTLLHSSGNSALDQSAKVAILKASPLPVPKDAALFDNFRELRLTVSPKTVVSENENDQTS